MSQFNNLKDQAGEQLQGDKAEQLSDQGLDKAQDAAGDRVGEDHADKLDQGRDLADERIGGDDSSGDSSGDPA